MPPHRKPRRTLTTAAFYDKAGAIADGSPQPSPTATSFGGLFDSAMGTPGMNRGGGGSGADSDDEYTLTGYGELSGECAFMLPPSPTQTIKYRYRAYRPKLARLRKHRSGAGKGPLKTKSSAYHPSDYSSILNAYLSGTPGRSPKRDFQALLQKYRESTESWRDAATPRKGPAATGSVRRAGSGASFTAR